MNIFRFVSAVALLLTSPVAIAHGEDKPGPHGGFIRMPGIFHTEVIAVEPNKLKVYLLDMKWANPSVRDSKLAVKFIGEKEFEGQCEQEKQSYLCTFDKAVDLNSKGKLRVESTREGKRGGTVEYPTPLTFTE